MFQGFPEGTEQFFLDLRFHNNAEYYHAEIARYRRDVQAPFYTLIEELVPTVLDIDSQMETRPYKILSRLRRDTRFSKDKTPYRDHLWTWFHRMAEPRENSLGFWFEFGPGRLSWGMGTWGDNRPLMDRMRREFAAKPEQYIQIIRSCEFPKRNLVLSGDMFKKIRIPETVPAVLEPWYRLKDVAIMQSRPDLREASSRQVLEHVRTDYLAMAPIYRMLRGWQDDLETEEAKRENEAKER